MSKNYGLISSVEQFEKFVERLIADGKPLGYDCETGYSGDPFEGGSLSPYYAPSRMVGFSFTNSVDWARYVPLSHDFASNLDNEAVAHLLWKLLNSVPVVAHNGRFETEFARKFFNTYIPDVVKDQDGWFPLFSDTMVEAYVAGTEEKFGLKALTKSVFDYDQVELIELFPNLPKNKSKTLRFNQLDLTPEVVSYACEDAAWCLALHEKFYPIVKDRFVFKIDMKILEVASHMEKEETGGVRFDWEAMARSSEELEIFIEAYNRQVMRKLSVLCGEEIDINMESPKQLRKVLFEQLGFRSAKQTDTGLDSTGAVALEALSKTYPVIREILNYKEMVRLRGTFLEAYPKKYSHSCDGYVHPSLITAFVRTGRFSCGSPNVQQLPAQPYFYEVESTEEKESIKYELNFRDLLISKPDHYWLGYDYSQIELRVLAGIANEPYLLNAFEAKKDIHSATASLMLGIPLEEITKEQRYIGKTLGFAILYGLGEKALGDRLAISKKEAEALYQKYNSAFSNVAAWKDGVVRDGWRNGYVSTKFGRVVKIWEFLRDESWMQAGGERLCVNAVIQGSAADFMRVAMVRQRKALIEAGLIDRVHLTMNIHDALEYQVHDSVDPAQLVEVLQPAVCFDVSGLPKIIADWHIGLNWGSALTIEFVDGKPIIPDFRTVAAPKPIVVQSSTGKQIVITLLTMPSKESYTEFKAAFVASAGSNVVQLVTPQGTLNMKGTTGIHAGGVDSVLRMQLQKWFPGCVIEERSK